MSRVSTKGGSSSASAEGQNIQQIPLKALEFDPENPRLPSTVDGSSEREVANWMLSDASILELMGSIGEKGYFAGEPMLVIPSENPDKYIVIEGNRRLTAVKLLNSPTLATKKQASIRAILEDVKVVPKTLPVVVFETRSEILDYLGFKHITGVKPWSALAKAKYLEQLKAEFKGLESNDLYKKLARSIGSRADYVRELLVGLALYETINDNDFFDIPGLDEESIDFGVYYNALKYKSVVQFLKIDPASSTPTKKVDKKHLKEFTTWLSNKDASGTTRLGESRNLGKLASIVDEPKALRAFREGRSIQDALLYTGEPIRIFRKLLKDSDSSLSQANQSLAHIAQLDISDLDLIKELLLKVRQISAIANELLS